MGRPKTWFLWLQKKRGAHRTISPEAAFWGELGIFCLILLAGLVGLWILARRIIIPYWATVTDFRPQFGLVRAWRVAEHVTAEGTLYRPEVLVSFQINDREYTTWVFDPRSPLGEGYLADKESAERRLTCYPKGSVCQIWYDPQDPQRAILSRDLPWWTWLILFVPTSLVILGIAGLVMVLQGGRQQFLLMGMSTRSPRLAGGEVPESNLWPTVPRPLTPPDSPGVRLPIRLPLLPVALGSVIGWFVASLLWTGLSFTLLAWAITTLAVSQGDWSFLAFSIALVGVGVFWTGSSVRQVTRRWRVGPTIVEISEQPLLPGERYQVYLAQLGSIKVNRLSVYLVCEERVVFREGTEMRTESRQVYSSLLFRREAFEVRAGVPFEAFFDFQLPRQVMHSFRSLHNQIVWMIVVENVIVGLPPVKQHFPVVVYPPHSGKVSP